MGLFDVVKKIGEVAVEEAQFTRAKIDNYKYDCESLSDKELVAKYKSSTNSFERQAIKELAQERGLIS